MWAGVPLMSAGLTALCNLCPGLLYMSPHSPWTSSFLGHSHLMVDCWRAKGRPSGANTFKPFADIISTHIPLAKASHSVKSKVIRQGSIKPKKERQVIEYLLNNICLQQLSSLLFALWVELCSHQINMLNT